MIIFVIIVYVSQDLLFLATLAYLATLACITDM